MAREGGKNRAPRAKNQTPAEKKPRAEGKTIYYNDGSRYEPGIGFLDEDGYLIGSDPFEDDQRLSIPRITIV